MGKVRYKQGFEKFDKIAPSTSNNIQKQNLARGNRVREILYISVQNIIPFYNQPRKVFDEKDLHALAGSIKEVGITNPLLVMKTSKIGVFQVINGERRLRAAKLLNLEKVPCIVAEDNDQLDFIAIIDNIQRSDLHPIELSDAYSSLVKNYGDKKIISQKLGIGYTSFVETLKLNELPEEIKNYLLNKNIKSRAVFRNVLKLSSLEKMKQYLGMVKNENSNFKKKKLLDISIKNNKIELFFKKENLDQNEKQELILKVKEVLLVLEET